MEPTSWQCPFCGNHATVGQYDVEEGLCHLHSSTAYGTVRLHYGSVRCPNSECKEVSLEVRLVRDMPGGGHRPVKKWQLCPESEAKPQPEYIPLPIREDYYESCLIKGKSPKASATLARRCLQGMVRDFWEVEEKPNLYQEIEAIKEKVPLETWKAIDAVRRIGNIGAHMEKDVNLIVDVESHEAGKLIELIEFLFQDWYVSRASRRAAQARIIEIADQKDAQRKKSSDDSGDAEPA